MNYSGLAQRLREQIHGFSGKLSTQFSVPKQRFIEQMVYGICARQDVKLSEIARSLEEDVALIGTEKRLSRNLDTEGMDEKLIDEVVRLGARRVHKDTLLVIDVSDITKPYAKKMEHLGKVRDGSTGEIRDGYWTCNVIACEEGKRRVVPLYQSLYSARAPGFESENEEIVRAVDAVRRWTNGRGIYVMDRGGDRENLLHPFLDRQMHFIVRLACLPQAWLGTAICSSESVGAAHWTLRADVLCGTPTSSSKRTKREKAPIISNMVFAQCVCPVGRSSCTWW